MDNIPRELQMVAILAATKEFLIRSTEPGWCSRSREDAIQDVEEAISYVLDRESKPKHFDFLFGTTWTIHEISLSNGWDTAFDHFTFVFERLARDFNRSEQAAS